MLPQICAGGMWFYNIENRAAPTRGGYLIKALQKRCFIFNKQSMCMQLHHLKYQLPLQCKNIALNRFLKTQLSSMHVVCLPSSA